MVFFENPTFEEAIFPEMTPFDLKALLNNIRESSASKFEDIKNIEVETERFNTKDPSMMAANQIMQLHPLESVTETQGLSASVAPDDIVEKLAMARTFQEFMELSKDLLYTSQKNLFQQPGCLQDCKEMIRMMMMMMMKLLATYKPGKNVNLLLLIKEGRG